MRSIINLSTFPREDHFLSRGVSVVMAVGTVYVVYLCGFELFARRAAGIFAAFLVAVMPPFVYYAKTVHLDVPYVFWFSLSLLSYLRAIKGNQTWDYIRFASLGSPSNRSKLRRWITLVPARTTRGRWASFRPGSGPMLTAWTTWSGCDGPLASPAGPAATMGAGGWAMAGSCAPGAAVVPL